MKSPWDPYRDGLGDKLDQSEEMVSELGRAVMGGPLTVADQLQEALRRARQSAESWQDACYFARKAENNLAWLALVVTLVQRMGGNV